MSPATADMSIPSPSWLVLGLLFSSTLASAASAPLVATWCGKVRPSTSTTTHPRAHTHLPAVLPTRLADDGPFRRLVLFPTHRLDLSATQFRLRPSRPPVCLRRLFGFDRRRCRDQLPARDRVVGRVLRPHRLDHGRRQDRRQKRATGAQHDRYTVHVRLE